VRDLTTALVKAETGKLKAEGSDKPVTDRFNPQLSAFSFQPSPTSVQKNLPVFLTEVGYGMLGKSARDTKEGRLRQWRWFKSVGEQIAILRPEAPMAFYLRPYLEYDTSEYGLTVPAKQETEKAEGGKLKAEGWIAGGIKYSPGDFGAEKAEPWMSKIGSDIGGNEATPALAWWLAGPREPSAAPQLSAFSSQLSERSRSWSVTTALTSPVVLDFLPGEGLSHVKRYNGLFVTGREPPVHKKPETGNLKPEVLPTKPLPPTPLPSAPSRSEELILQLRTQNGNLYEVYPTRQATPEWQRFLEPGDNFTMAFYGRAALPWRFKENKPASLVVVMYPKSLPATYEFRRPQLIKFGKPLNTEIAENAEKTLRYGQGKVVVYNFSDKPISGRLVLPEYLTTEHTESKASEISASSVVKLLPNERREIPVSIKVPWDRYERIPVEISFVPIADNLQVSGFRFQVSDRPVSRFRTDLIPDIAGLPATLVADLLAHRMEDRGQTTEDGQQPNNQEPSTNNRDFVATRPRASEEAPMVEQSAESKAPSTPANSSDSLSPSPYALTAFAQSGATVERTTDGFAVTVSSIPAGRSQRIEVEIPWPDGLAFGEDEFLSLEFRLRP
jgi:hypothetical protein